MNKFYLKDHNYICRFGRMHTKCLIWTISGCMEFMVLWLFGLCIISEYSIKNIYCLSI